MGKRKYNLNDYLITMDGKVISKISGKERKLVDSGKGYLQVEIADKKYLVHRLVAKMYLPNPDNLPEVNHKDGNKLNNCVENLEWCTNRENSLHALHNGMMWIEERHPMSKLKREDVVFIKSHPEMSRNELAEMFNVKPHTITDIRNGRTWKTVEKIC